jgi:hypothetical protein
MVKSGVLFFFKSQRINEINEINPLLSSSPKTHLKKITSPPLFMVAPVTDLT